MNSLLQKFARSYSALVVLAASLCILVPLAQHSTWHKERLYARLLTGTRGEQLKAASTLAYLKAEDYLFRALQSSNTTARETGQRALEYVWFTSAGPDAYRMLKTAYSQAEHKEVDEAMATLNRLVRAHPKYAEGWNRRAALLWEQGRYEQARADSEQTLALNPRHYGAWQGLGVYYLEKGNIPEACRCFRAALKLIPHDPATQEALRKAEDLLRVYPPATKPQKRGELV